MESLLQINDELNGCFTRYDRHMKNRQAAAQNGGNETSFTEPSGALPPPVDSNAFSINYPSLDDPPPYEKEDTTQQGGDEAVGQLIDLGIDLNTPQPPPTSKDDIVNQLAQIGITSEPAPLGGGGVMGGTKGDLLSSFDMFAHSRLAYSNTTEGSTYEDNRQEQGSSLTSALLRQPQPEPVPTNQYENLTEWVGTTTGETQQQQQQPTQQDQATSAEFDQFLADRASKGGRHRPQMQKHEELNDELFQL